MKERILELLKEIRAYHFSITSDPQGITNPKENFNIFKILGVQSRETRLHSALIAELLNPKGSHGLKNEPLKIFVKSFGREIKDLFNYEKGDVKTEVFIGKIKDNITGGRIDILIRDNLNTIIIENKIYAGDQENQLLRYKRAYQPKDTLILYLTLDGHEASSISTNNEMQSGIDYFCLSYKEDIVYWLEECKKIPQISPCVYETIQQYLNLIDDLTNTEMTAIRNNELLEILENNITESQEILINSSEFLLYLIEKYIYEPLKNWATQNGLECENQLNKNKNYSGIVFYKPEWQKQLKLEFGGRQFKDLYYGACWRLEPKIEDKNYAFPNFNPNHINNGWPYGWQSAEHFRNLGFENLIDIKNNIVSDYYIECLEGMVKAISENPKIYKM